MKKVSGSVSTRVKVANPPMFMSAKAGKKPSRGSVRSAKRGITASTPEIASGSNASSKIVKATSSLSGPISFPRTQNEAQAVAVSFTSNAIVIDLADGRKVMTPLLFYPTLKSASRSSRSRWEYLGWGSGLEWPDLELQHSVESIVLGKREHIPRGGVRAFANRAASAAAKLGLRVSVLP